MSFTLLIQSRVLCCNMIFLVYIFKPRQPRANGIHGNKLTVSLWHDVGMIKGTSTTVSHYFIRRQDDDVSVR